MFSGSIRVTFKKVAFGDVILIEAQCDLTSGEGRRKGNAPPKHGLAHPRRALAEILLLLRVGEVTSTDYVTQGDRACRRLARCPTGGCDGATAAVYA